jgi:calcineurin-like phosphoesterase
LNILAVGDVVGRPGIEMLNRHLRTLKRLKDVSFVIANGENANGLGITKGQAEEIFSAGVDVITPRESRLPRPGVGLLFRGMPHISCGPRTLRPRRRGGAPAFFFAGSARIRVINLIAGA